MTWEGVGDALGCMWSATDLDLRAGVSAQVGQHAAVASRGLGMTHVPEIPAEEDPLAQPMLTKRGVAMYLGISERTVDRLVAAGDLQAYRIGGHRRFRLWEVEAFVEGSREAVW